MSEIIDFREVREYTRKKVNDDGYIEEELWYSKWDGNKFINERGSHFIKTIDGKDFFVKSDFQEEYHRQEERRKKLAEDLKKWNLHLYKD